jgi:hypothetical protein
MDALLRAISVCTYGRIQLIIHNGLRRVPVSIILDQQALPRRLRAVRIGDRFRPACAASMGRSRVTAMLRSGRCN